MSDEKDFIESVEGEENPAVQIMRTDWRNVLAYFGFQTSSAKECKGIFKKKGWTGT